ncbi:DMT family transporter [Marinobacter sp. CHS3-4]|uniref:DMT family transporter n=1 Tax=Marinobacter sp. CHS3-4 TaxID=3045174 RepID=UPI0024B519A0|nr:DMT family transporter [Marinobacter sp. CHS3-4]MDI9246433.1 DMT family transporter [Marinobacter sp. CHS3-4]
MITSAQPTRKWVAPLLYLLAGGAMLGTSTNLAKLAQESGLAPLSFLFWSILGAALLLFLRAFKRKQLPPISSRTLEYYAVSAFTGVAGSNLLFFSAIPHVGAGFVALLISLPPILTYAGAVAFRIESFRRDRALGVLSALVGATILALGKFAEADINSLWAMPVFAGVILLAIGNLYRTLRWPRGLTVNELAPGMLIAAAVMLAMAGFLPGLPLGIPTSLLEVALIAVQSIVFAAMFLFLFLLQTTGGPVLLSLLGSVGAVVGVPVAVFLQGEPIPNGLAAGALFISLGIILLIAGKPRSKNQTTSHGESTA